MSISEKITSITNHLIDDYTALETLGVSVEDRNIENIKDMANQIYAKFPKTSYAEGSNITLSNTLKGKLDFEDGIVGIGQSEQYSTNGYQLLSSEKANQSSSLSVKYISGAKYNCKTTSSGNQLIFTGIGLSSGNYVVSIQVTRGTYSGGNFVVRNSSNSVVGEGAISGTNRLNITISSNDINSILLWGASANLDFDFDIQISSGTTAQNFEQYTGGQASPSPSYPQEIKYVRGKNRFNKDNFESYNGFVNITTKKVNYNASIKSIIIGCESNTTYTVQKLNGGNYDRFSISSFTSKPTVNSVATNVIGDNSAKSLTITSGTSDKFLMILYYNTNETTYTESQILDSIQIEENTTSTPYLPYNTIEEVVSGMNELDVPSNFNSESSSYGLTYSIIEDTIYINGTATGYSGTYTKKGFNSGDEIIPLKAGHTYRLLAKVLNNSGVMRCYCGSKGENIFRIIDINSNGIYYYDKEITEDMSITHFSVIGSQSAEITQTNTQVQLAFYDITNSSLATYEPYITPKTYQLSLGDIELCKIGTYQDYIYKSGDKWYVHKEIGKKENIKGGDFSLYQQNIGNNVYQFRTGNNYFTGVQLTPDPFSIEDIAYSNYFLKKAGLNSLDNYYFTITGMGAMAINTPYANVTSLTNWLSDKNLMVYYQLATPTDTEITDTTLISQLNAWYNAHSLKGTTIITSNGNLPMIIKVRGLKGE